MRNDLTKSPTFNTIMVGMFAAICYVVLYLKIPFGGQFIHFGNHIVVLTSLLFGGIQGGLGGAIGMGLHDLFNGYSHHLPATIPQKFLMGYVAWLVAKILRKFLPDIAASFIGAVVGVSINVAIEFIYLLTFKMRGFALPAILAKLNSSFINAATVLVAVLVLYLPLKLALEKAGLIESK